MRPSLGRGQVVHLVVAGLVVVSGLAAVASPALHQQDAPRQSLTEDTPPTTQMGPAATTVTPPKPGPAWLMDRANAANTNSLDTTGPTSPLTTRWTFDTGDSGAEPAGPVVSNGTVYFGDKRVYAFDAWTGEERLNVTLPSGNGVSSIAVFRDTLYAGTYKGRVYALDVATGEPFWTFRSGAWVRGLTVADGTLVVASKANVGESHVYALDALTGDERWKFSKGQFHDPPAVKDGTVYISNDNGPLYALDAKTGVERWTFESEREIYDFSNPTVANGLVYVKDSRPRNADRQLYALDADTGEQQWAFAPVGKAGPPTVMNDTLYVGVRGNGLFALDASSGSERWHVRQFDRSPVVVANAGYVPKGRSMYSLHPANGSELGRITPPQFNNSWDRFRGKAVLNGSLYIGAELDVPGGDRSGDRTVFYAVGTPEFEYMDLSVTPQSPGVNESVQVTATVRNTGTGPGTFNATLGVDGTVTNTTTGKLDPRTISTVKFTHTFQENGTYTLGIGGRTRRIAVGDVAPPPTPTPTATARPLTSQNGTQQSDTTPMSPKTTNTPPTTTVPGFGVNVAAAAVAVVTTLLARRRWP